MMHKINILQKTLVIAALLGFTVALILSAGGVQAAGSPYGSGKYGACPYQNTCSTKGSSVSSIPATPQTPTTDNPNISITTNVSSSTNVSPTTNFDVTAQLKQTINGVATVMTSAQIGWVVLYVNDKQATAQYTPDSNNVYHLAWNVSAFPGTRISLVAYDKQGTLIKRKDVTIASNAATTTTTPNPSSQPLSAETPKPKITLSPVASRTLQTFPYWLFVVLFGLAIRYWLQNAQEKRALKQLNNAQLPAAAPPSMPTAPATVSPAMSQHTNIPTHPPIANGLFWTIVGSATVICAVVEIFLMLLTNVPISYVDIGLQIGLDIGAAGFLLFGLRQRYVHRSHYAHAAMGQQAPALPPTTNQWQ
jgi:hypothetical protein